MNAKWLVKRFCLIVAIAAGFNISGRAQPFINLNFENANVQVNDPNYGFLDWSLAAPGWGHSPGSDSGHVFYFSAHLGNSGYFLLVSSNSPSYAPGTQLAGSYSLALRGGQLLSYDVNSPWQDAYISQTGAISATTHSIRLLATGPFQVQINGTPINMVSSGGNLYTGDISSFAGTTSELRIIDPTFVEVRVDNIQFSTAVVPEPSCAGLFIIALTSFAIRRRRPGHG